MTVRVHLSPDLTPGGSPATWEVEAQSLADCLAAVEARFPGLRARLADAEGRLQREVRLSINGEETTSLGTRLAGNEVVVFETATIAARTRVHALARLRRRGRMEEEYERSYSPFAAEGPCAGGLGEGLLFATLGVAFLLWGLGSLLGFAGAEGEVTLANALVTALGLALLGWGLWNVFGDLFE